MQNFAIWRGMAHIFLCNIGNVARIITHLIDLKMSLKDLVVNE